MSKTTITLNATIVPKIAMHGRTVRLAADGLSIGVGAAAGIATAKVVGLRLAAMAAAEGAALAPMAVVAAPIAAGVVVGLGATFGVAWGVEKVFGHSTVVTEEVLAKTGVEVPETPAAETAETAAAASA